MKSYISRDPQIMGGMPVIAGTRIPVGRIVYLLKDGYTLEAIHEQYPHVALKMLEGAIDQVAKTLSSSRHGPQIL